MNLKENNLKVNVIEQRKQKNSTSDWKRRKVKKKIGHYTKELK